jgi:hypothetical protein
LIEDEVKAIKMPASRHHNEWLSLIEVSGPFLSVPVLERVFPHGLDAHDPEQARLLKLAFEEWEDNQQDEQPSPALHREWINFVLKQTLELPDEVLLQGQDIPQTLRATVAEHGETLRPDIVVRNPDGAGKARLLIRTYPPTQDLEKPITGRHWKASPATRMMELLHATDTRLGLVSNGEHWMLVDAPKGETTGFASWYANLWLEEPLTLRAFRSLLGVHRFFSAADDETLEAMLKESASNQQEVTDRLGYQVREAVEVIIRSLDRIDRDAQGELLLGVSEPDLYEAALTVMMRLVFLFSAEERGLLLLGDPLYDEHYAVSTLVAKLQEAADQHGEEVLERRHDAWVRLLSTFRAVYGGVRHDRLKLLPYAGRLFDPDRFPFLEGRRPGTTWKDIPATPLPIDNRTVLHLLRSLQYLEMHGEARRLSFRALDIEQIGHVYEGLLDHTARRATEPTLSLTAAKGDEPEVALPELERLKAKGDADLLRFLKEQTGRSENALKKALDNPLDGDAAKKLRAACGDDRLFNRVRPFSGLVRNDTFGRPVVIRPGSVFVTAGTDRRSSGTHYTPRSLTEPIVQYTLEPLVYIGPAEGNPKEEWTLRPARELLDLKVCDMACGSGAFLVQACRYLSERLVEAWEDAEKQHPGVPGITPEGTAATGSPREQLIPRETIERLAYARRLIAQRCLYGVDKNPLAVEMAKLSIWLLTLAKDKPFTFVDHAIRCGDSLVGIRDIRQVQFFQLDLDQADRSIFSGPVMSLVDEAVALRKRIEALPVDTVEDVREKERLLGEADEKTARLRSAADLLISVEFQPAPEGRATLHQSMAIKAGEYVANYPMEELKFAAKEALGGRQTFHWALEFPEVFSSARRGELEPQRHKGAEKTTCGQETSHRRSSSGGFDAFVCNPPFMGGTTIRGKLGKAMLGYLTSAFASRTESGGRADLCAYFLMRAHSLAASQGCLGMITTNTIAQGDTREIGLDVILGLDGTIIRATPTKKWPGDASLEVAQIWLRRGPWLGSHYLNESRVQSIDSYLSGGSRDRTGVPYRLAANKGLACEGSKPMGIGFVITDLEAAELLTKSAKNKEVVFRYINGEDFTSSPTQEPSRWIINFFDWSEAKARHYTDCWSIIDDRVKPYRQERNGDGAFVRRSPLPQKYWLYGDSRTDFYAGIQGLRRIIVAPQTSKYVTVGFQTNDRVFGQTVVMIALDDFGHFAVLASTIHAEWIMAYCSSLKKDPRYLVTDGFETFPFPLVQSSAERIGERYHEARNVLMLSRQEGLTKTYNRFHNPDESAADIQKLRDLHIEMDKAVAAAYDWDDLDLDHGFHEAKQGLRFTISESARRKVLDRLLKLNHERYAEEVAQGLHDKKAKGKTKPKTSTNAPKSGSGKKSKASSAAMPLFADDEADPDSDPDPDPSAGPDGDPSAGPEPETEPERPSSRPARPDRHVQRPAPAEPPARPTPIDEIETDAIMAAFRQAARGRGWLGRDDLLKDVSLVLGYQRLGPKIDEALRGHLRAAVRRRIIETDGPDLVRAGTATMADYDLDELREVFRSVMRKGTNYEREEVIQAMARYLGFVRQTDTIREPIKSAINSAIRRGLLGYERETIWRID